MMKMMRLQCPEFKVIAKQHEIRRTYEPWEECLQDIEENNVPQLDHDSCLEASIEDMKG